MIEDQNYATAENLEVTDESLAANKNGKWKSILLCIALGFSLSILILSAITFEYEFSASESIVTQSDLSLILDINQLSEWFPYSFYPVEGIATIEKVRYPDNAFEILYEYDDPSDPAAPYLLCVVYCEADQSIEALLGKEEIITSTIYSDYWDNFELGFPGEIIERNDLFSWGAQSRFGVLIYQNEPTGNLFLARDGGRIFFVTFSGVYFDDSDSIRQLLEENLDQLTAYRPSTP